MDVLADGAWEKIFKVKPAVFTAEEKHRGWLKIRCGAGIGCILPFGDDI